MRSAGIKIKRPINSAVMLLIITAAAATSLIFFMFGLSSGRIKSAIFSNAVFNNSQTNTKPMEKSTSNPFVGTYVKHK
jgi:hypothetical protein